MKTILVTGGAGYVGSHACKAMAAAGWRVVVYDNLSRGWRDMVKWGPLIEGDILDPVGLDAAFEATKPDAVAHFAAFAYVGESVDDPILYYRNNVVGTLNLLEAMKRHGVKRLVFSSSCATYGQAQSSRIGEDHPQAPLSPYGWSKLVAEQMLKDCRAAYDIRFVGLRYFNAAGADPEGEIGERHVPETHVIPLAARGALDPNYEFVIFGGDFDTRDGTAVRDYIHVADLGKAHAAAADHLLGGGEGGFFNLGTGEGTTVKEIADAIEAVCGAPLRRRVGPRRAGDPASVVASNGRAGEVLGWTPERSTIRQIVQNAWDWHSKDKAPEA